MTTTSLNPGREPYATSTTDTIFALSIGLKWLDSISSFLKDADPATTRPIIEYQINCFDVIPDREVLFSFVNSLLADSAHFLT